MPTASVSTAAAVKPGLRESDRTAYAASLRRSSSHRNSNVLLESVMPFLDTAGPLRLLQFHVLDGGHGPGERLRLLHDASAVRRVDVGQRFPRKDVAHVHR